MNQGRKKYERRNILAECGKKQCEYFEQSPFFLFSEVA